MTLKYQVESLEGLDEAAKGLYKEQDGGGYVLQVEGVVPKSQFDEVNQKAVDNATEAARRRKTLERVTGKLGLEDASGLDDALEELLSKKPAKTDADHEAVLAQIKQRYESELEATKAQLKEIQLGSVESNLRAELQSQGFPAKVAEMVARSSLSRVQLDDNGKPRIMQDNGNPLAGSGADGFATFGDLAKELAAAMPELLVDTGKGGGGKPPASGGGSGGVASWKDAKSAKDKVALLKQKRNT